MKTLLKIAIILLMVGIFFYEANNMFIEQTSISYSILHPLLILLSSLFIIIASNQIIFIRKQMILISFNLLLYLFAILHSTHTPFGSRILYITLALPFFCLLIASIIASNKNYRPVFLNSIFIIYLLLTVFYFKNYQSNILIDADSQSNAAYTLLYFTPILLCHPQKLIRNIVLLLTGCALLFSLKRSGILSFAFATTIYTYILVFIVNQKKNKFRLVCFILIAIACFYGVIQTHFSDRADILLERFEELSSGGGSGRDVIYQSTWDMISRSDIIGTLFGHGYNSVAKDSTFKLSAHNDYLEIMYDYGLFTLLFLILFVIQLFSHTIKLVRKKSEYSAPVAFILSVIVINSMFSHIFFYEWYFMIISLFWGYITSINENSFHSSKKSN